MSPASRDKSFVRPCFHWYFHCTSCWCLVVGSAAQIGPSYPRAPTTSQPSKILRPRVNRRGRSSRMSATIFGSCACAFAADSRAAFLSAHVDLLVLDFQLVAWRDERCECYLIHSHISHHPVSHPPNPEENNFCPIIIHHPLSSEIVSYIGPLLTGHRLLAVTLKSRFLRPWEIWLALHVYACPL